jgi:hypothetical protein
MQLAPHTASSREPPRCAETNVHFRVGGRARPPFTANAQMPIVAALAGEIVEGRLDNRRSAEQLRIAFTDGLPTTPDAAHRVVRAWCVPLLPVCRKSIKVTRVEGPIKLDQCVERISAAAPHLAARNFISPSSRSSWVIPLNSLGPLARIS